MDPVAALTEIAFWLERELAPSFKVQAFRKAEAWAPASGAAAAAAKASATPGVGIAKPENSVVTSGVTTALPGAISGDRYPAK